MTATITVTTGHSYNNAANFRTSVKAGLAAIGIAADKIEYDTGSHVICKISSGSGTYVDNFIRFEYNGNTTYAHSMQMGTGWTSGTDVTGAGLEQAGFYAATASKKHRTIKANDGTFGIVQILNDTTDVCEGSYGFVIPTNTTQTAANIPLVMGLGSIKSNTVQTGTSGSVLGTDPTTYSNTNKCRYWSDASNTYTELSSEGNVRYLYSAVKKGVETYSALGHSVKCFGGSASSSSTYYGNAVYSISYGLTNNISGSIPIIPNLPIMSGGVPIGYNSNLVLCPPNLAPGDNLIVSAGSEEYTVISSDGIAIRKV